MRIVVLGFILLFPGLGHASNWKHSGRNKYTMWSGRTHAIIRKMADRKNGWVWVISERNIELAYGNAWTLPAAESAAESELSRLK